MGLFLLILHVADPTLVIEVDSEHETPKSWRGDLLMKVSFGVKALNSTVLSISNVQHVSVLVQR